MLNQAVIPFTNTTFQSRSIRADTLQPRVTYVISCYNHERYIESCVLSVLEQDYHNIELLCFDDGSSDRSASILHRWCQSSTSCKVSEHKRAVPRRHC